MQTKRALHAYAGRSPDWGDGPLANVAERLLTEFRAREADRLSHVPNAGPVVAIVERHLAAMRAQELLNLDLPMATRFDTYEVLRKASAADPSDRGLKLAAAHARRIWERDPVGVVAVGDVARLRTHYLQEHPRSKVAHVLDVELPKVGFNTLPLAKLATLSGQIHGTTQEALEASYQEVCRTAGLDGRRPDQVRARAYLRGLVNLAVDEPSSAAPLAGGAAAADRALARMAAAEDPILRAVAQLEDPMIEAELPHDEPGEEMAEVTSPITGDSLVLELGQAVEPELAPEVEEMAEEPLAHFGQLSDFEDAVPLEEGPGETHTIIEDPSAPGELLDVTLAPVPAESEGGEAPAEGASMALAARLAKAPPGKKYEKMVLELKDKEGVANPYAAAWAQYDKDCAKKAFTIYAVHNGVQQEEPFDRVEAANMAQALHQVAMRCKAVEANGEVRARPEEFSQRAFVHLSDSDQLIVVAEEQGTEFEPEINTQQPDQVKVPENGLKALLSDGGFSQPRSTLKVDVSTGASSVERTLSAAQAQEAAASMGLTAERVETQLLEKEAFTHGEWSLTIGEGDQVTLARQGRSVRKHALRDLDAAIADFLALAAANAPKTAAVDEPEAAKPSYRVEVASLATIGCPTCGGMDEYAFPKSGSAPEVECGHCRSITPARLVQAQLNAPGSVQGHVIIAEIPGMEDGLEAQRLILAVQKAVPGAAAAVQPNSRLMIEVRPADLRAVAYVQQMLHDQFGVQSRTAQAAPPQEMQTTLVQQVAPPSNTPATSPTYQPPPVTPPPPIGMSQPVTTTAPAPNSSKPVTVGGPAPSTTVVTTGPATNKAPSTSMPATAGVVPIFEVRYADASGRPRSVPIEARDEAGARRIFAMHHRTATVLSVHIAQELPEPPEEAMSLAPPAAPAAGMPLAMPMAPMAPPAAAIPAEVSEAIHAALMTYRNSGVDIAAAIKDFQGQFKQLMERFGEEGSAGRQALGAEIVRAAQEAWTRPAILDVTAGKRAQAGDIGPGDDYPDPEPMRITISNTEDEDMPSVLVIADDAQDARNDQTIRGSNWEFDGDFAYAIISDEPDLIAKLEADGYNVEAGEYYPMDTMDMQGKKAEAPPPGLKMPSNIKPSQGNRVSLPKTTKLLGPDSASDPAVTKAIEPKGPIKSQHPPKGKMSDTKTQPGSDSNDPGSFGAKLPSGNGKVPPSKGTSKTPTDLGKDSATGDNATTKKWDAVSKGAPKNMRSAMSAMSALAQLMPNELGTSAAGRHLSAAVQEAKAGVWPEAALWDARDAAANDQIPQLTPRAIAAWKLALEAL